MQTQTERDWAARQHDADMVDRDQCWLCLHIGLRYERDVIGQETHAFKVCPKCGAKREV